MRPLRKTRFPLNKKGQKEKWTTDSCLRPTESETRPPFASISFYFGVPEVQAFPNWSRYVLVRLVSASMICAQMTGNVVRLTWTEDFD
jgi:hypothetical protein